MATKIVGEDGDLRWSPSTFGSYSVDKTQQIVDILKDLISTITIDVNIDEETHRNYYTKEEIDSKLLLYFLKQDFQDFLGDKVSDLIGQYILSQEAVGRIVSTDTTNKMKKVMNYLTKVCFDETYDVMEVQEDFPTPISYFYRMDNLEGRTSAVETQADTLCSDLYTDPSQRSGFRALRDTSIVTVSEDSSTKIPSASLEYSLRQIIDDLSTRVDTLETNVGSINDPVSTLDTSYSTWKDQVISKLQDIDQRLINIETTLGS